MSYIDFLGLPASITGNQTYSPMEDVVLTLLRQKHSDVSVYSTIPFRQTPDEVRKDMFVLVRRIPSWGLWAGRGSLVDSGGLSIHVFTKDPDGDAKGAIVSEAIRKTLFTAYESRWYSPDVGAINRLVMDEEPVRRTDWATSSGPVQFADLPSGWWRYETRYRIWVRPSSLWKTP